MIRVILHVTVLLSLLLARGTGRTAASEGEPSRYFAIEVVDEQTGRGVPMVELQATSGVRYYTDSSGLIAFHEPGLMDKRVFFAVSAHGYEFAKDGFGIRGVALDAKAGGTAKLKIKRVNLAERLYRITGQGIYRDTMLLGRKAPIAEPLLNAQVTGQDSVLTAVYRDKAYWFYGDTNRLSYALGNFATSGATTETPEKIDPSAGLDLKYFVGKDGFSRPMAPMKGEGVVWLTGVVVVPDPSGRERMFAYFERRRGLGAVLERGFVEYNDTGERFEKVATVAADPPLVPTGHPFRVKQGGIDYFYFTAPYPALRVKADRASYLDLASYEGYTCLKTGSRYREKEAVELDRDAAGKLMWGWKKDTPPLSPKAQQNLVTAGKISREDSPFRLQDADSGKPFLLHGGSCAWNEYRKKYIMIASEVLGATVLGEIWYAEADRPEGPWVQARKIITHANKPGDAHDFYNPTQHPFFDRDGGRLIYLEGTYVNTFSGNPHPTPYYEYNQIMYRLDLSDPRLKLAVRPEMRINPSGLTVGLAAGRDQSGPQLAAPAFPVTIRVDAAKTIGDMRPVWRFFGYDEPNYTYMKDGLKLLGQLKSLSPQTVFIRTHNLLTSGDGQPALKWGSTGVYSEDEHGVPRYNWTILDHIFDTYLDRGVRPYVQIGFMPEALSTHPQPYKHEWTPGGRKSISTGWAYPPKDYSKWAEVVFQWVRHTVERYGRDEVEQWYWEVWNEPNIFYWRGTPEEYHKLYDFAVDAVKRALPTAKVGGPHVAGPRSAGGSRFLRAFLDHCVRGTNHATEKQGSPLDFIAFHAKGQPEFVDGHVRTGIGAQLQDIDRGFEIVASYPALRGKPIIIGESDPDGCAACPATIYPQNGYRNGTLYSSYTAASFARKYLLADKHRVNLEGAVTWAFEFEDQPYFAGFRVLSTNGIPLPVLNVFRMFGMMGGQRLAVESSAEVGLEAIRKQGVRAKPDVSAIASMKDGKMCMCVWHHHDDDVPGPSAEVELSINELTDSGGPVLLKHFRIDQDHSNAFETWKQMGSPQQPTLEQYARLERASQLALLTSPAWVRSERGKLTLKFHLPRQAVSLIVLDGAVKSK